METKLKVLLLGNDANLLEKNCERLNSSHPLEVSYFTDLKYFLEKCINLQPDIVGISFNYHHKSITQFPRIIEMAVNIPVIVFGEDRNNKVIQDIIVAKTPYKITGGMTAQNLWVQISKFIKTKSDQQTAETFNSNGFYNSSNHENVGLEKPENNFNNPSNKNNTVFLKGESKVKSEEDKNKLLNSLFSSLNSGIDSSNEDQSNIIKSSDATAYRRNEVNHVNTSDTKSLMDVSSLEDNINGEENKNNNSFYNPTAIKSEENKNSEGYEKNKKDIENFKDESVSNGRTIDDETTDEVGLRKNRINFSEKKPTQKLKKADEETSGLGDNNQSKMPKMISKSALEKKSNGSDGPRENKGKLLDLQDEKLRRGIEKNKSIDNSNKKKKQRDDDSEANASTKEKSKIQDDVKIKKELGLAESDQPDKTKDKSKEGGKFGAIKLADEKELKENIKKKVKKKKEKDLQVKKNLLIESCDIALRKCFTSTVVTEPWAFESKSINVYIVEQSNYKGFLLLTNSFKHELEAHISEEFRATIIENFKKNGMGIEISHPFLITAKSPDYPELVTNFCDFVLCHEEGNGKEQVVSFLPREVVRPKLEQSEKEEMYFIDIKTIPPQTVVNFDAFLYLPKNQKFVRYLKDGRSLSLEQAKRQSEVLQNSKLYLPKEQKQKFIEFFVQNTIDWEIAISQKKIAI